MQSNERRPASFLSLSPILLITSPFFGLMVWMEVGRRFGWKDAAYVFAAGFLIMCGMYAVAQRPVGSIQLPERFLIRWPLLILVCGAIVGVPISDVYLLHPDVSARFSTILIVAAVLSLNFALRPNIRRWQERQQRESDLRLGIHKK